MFGCESLGKCSIHCVCFSPRTGSTRPRGKCLGVSHWESAVHSVCVFQSEDRIYPSQGKMFGCEPYCKDFVWFHHKVGEENFYRQYDVKVQALNNMGAGPNTSVEIVMSAEDSEW